MAATLSVVTGPNSQVIGARGIPMANTPVLESRLTPVGWKRAVEYSGSRPWARACAGQARNHRVSAVSPHPQLAVEAAPPVQACADTSKARMR